MPKITLKVIKGFLKKYLIIVEDVKYIILPIWDAIKTFSSLLLNCSMYSDNLSVGICVENL